MTNPYPHLCPYAAAVDGGLPCECPPIPEQDISEPAAPTSRSDNEIESEAMELLQRVAAFGFSMSNKVGKDEFIQMMNEGALDHQQAAHEIMRLIATECTKARIDELLTGDSPEAWRQYRLPELKAQLPNPEATA